MSPSVQCNCGLLPRLGGRACPCILPSLQLCQGLSERLPKGQQASVPSSAHRWPGWPDPRHPDPGQGVPGSCPQLVPLATWLLIASLSEAPPQPYGNPRIIWTEQQVTEQCLVNKPPQGLHPPALVSPPAARRPCSSGKFLLPFGLFWPAEPWGCGGPSLSLGPSGPSWACQAPASALSTLGPPVLTLGRNKKVRESEDRHRDRIDSVWGRHESLFENVL